MNNEKLCETINCDVYRGLIVRAGGETVQPSYEYLPSAPRTGFS
jgi:hypothetical protein